MRGMGRVFQRGNVWWIDYHHKGQKIRETSERESGITSMTIGKVTITSEDARNISKSLKAMDKGKVQPPKAEQGATV